MLRIKNIDNLKQRHIYGQYEMWQCISVHEASDLYQIGFKCVARKRRSKFYKGDEYFVNIGRMELPDDHIAKISNQYRSIYEIRCVNTNFELYVTIDEIESEKAFIDCISKHILI